MTREMVLQWESELDEFVADIQSRLEDIADSITAANNTPESPAEPQVVPTQPAIDVDPAAAAQVQANRQVAAVVRPSSMPTPRPAAAATTHGYENGVAAAPANVTPSPANVMPAPANVTPSPAKVTAERGQASESAQSVDQDAATLSTSTTERPTSGPDETNDRLQAIKEKLAARLQGELS
mgnify:CR=1 FL=1